MAQDKELAELIRERYPFPISHAYSYLESRVDAEDRYQAVLACFEVTLKLIASIAVANFVRDIEQDPDFGDTSLFQKLIDTLDRPLSLGHWHDLLRLTLRPYATQREQLVVPALFDFYYRVTEHGNVKPQSDNVRIMQRFIQERNEDAHHRSRGLATAFQRQAALAELTQQLNTLMGTLGFLARRSFLYVEHAEYRDRQWHYLANLACGNTYPFPQDTWQTSHGVNSHRCLLVNEAGSAVLELHPFVIVTSEGRMQQPDIFFFDGIFRSGRASFMSYHVGDYIEPTDESSPASVASDAVHSLLTLLKTRSPAAAEPEVTEGERFSPVEIYYKSTHWASEHNSQSISLEALRQVLGLSREEALGVEQKVRTEGGEELEPEVEAPFEGVPTWANLAYYVLDSSGQEEMYYRDISAEAEQLKDQYDPDWEMGDSANVEATISAALSQDPRFYKLKQGYYRLTKHNELLSNPSWANLADFVLRCDDPRRKGMHLQEITDRALALKEKYSDWHRKSAQTPSHTVSATMSMDHRFEALPERGVWRLAAEETEHAPEAAAAERPDRTTRDQAYDALLTRLGKLGDVRKLPFGLTYYVVADRIHLMLRFSKAHERNGEVEYFLGVTPQYFERIRAVGNAFLAFVLGGADNVLLVPADTFAQWMEGVEPSGSGTWPMGFYESPDGKRIERWVPGEGREDVTAYRNDYAALEGVLAGPGKRATPSARKSIRVGDLFEAGLLKRGDVVHTSKHPDVQATIIDAKHVSYRSKRWKYIEWGKHVTGWKAVNIYTEFVLARTGQTLDELRQQLKRRET